MRKPKLLSPTQERERRETAIVADELFDVLEELADTVEDEEQLHAFMAHVSDDTQRARIIERIRPLLKFELASGPDLADKETVQ